VTHPDVSLTQRKTDDGEIVIPPKDEQLALLSRPFKSWLIHSNPSGGGDYVTHAVVVQKLLSVVGPFDFELVQILRGDVAAIAPNPSAKSDRGKFGVPALHDVIVGAVCRLRCKIDGRQVQVEEVRDCEQPHNWPHDGARMKDAMSDAFKRCAMRLGVGLHLWCKDQEFFLYDFLNRGGEDVRGSASSPPQISEAT
jgi:hypothetical protein